MSIGGGESGKYIFHITFDKVSFHNLVAPSKLDAIEKLVVGEQEGNYSARMCVNLETALWAAQTLQYQDNFKYHCLGKKRKN
jgi:hypothetical protein